MKKHLYIILCALPLMLASCTKDEVEPLRPAPEYNDRIALTGYSQPSTRTGFGQAATDAIPLLWSAGDYIWTNGSRSDLLETGGEKATFFFGSLQTSATYDVFYNMTGSDAETASIPARQTQHAAYAPELGANGDFGFATTTADGTFTLTRATSYVWFDLWTSDIKCNLTSISLSVSGGHTIAGEAAFADGALAECSGASSITLSFGEKGVALPAESSSDVFAAMVLYPADLAEATVSIVYTFADGSVCLQTKAGKTLVPGGTLRISTRLDDADRKTSGVFYMTGEGVSADLPDGNLGYVKVITLGDTTLSTESLTAIAGNLAPGASVDLGDAGYVATEFPNTFYNKTNLREIILPHNIETFETASNYSGAFYRCTNLRRAVLPEGVKIIPQNCFRECSSLDAVEIPASVTELGAHAFYNCKKLASVTIPEGITTLPNSLFQGCTALTGVKFPESLTELKNDVFNGCNALTEIVLPESVTTLGSSIFYNCKSLKNAHIPDGLTALPSRMFYACSALVDVNMPSCLESVGDEAFYQCDMLSDVTFPETLQTVGERSFGGCNAFTRVILDIPSVANYSFWSCANVATIDLGEHVTSIGRNSFITASNLQTIICRSEVPPTLGLTSFGSAGNKVEGKKYLCVPAASYDAYEREWADVIAMGYILEDINTQELTDGIYYRTSREADWIAAMPSGTFSEFYVKTVGGETVLTETQLRNIASKIAAQQTPVAVDLHAARYVSDEFPTLLAGNARLGSIRCFDNTGAIAAGAFAGCTAMTKAVIPNGTTAVPERTFEGCTALNSITVPSSVTAVGDKAFKGCAALTDVTLSSVDAIGEEAFSGCGLTSATISATTLGNACFSGCDALASVTLNRMTDIPAEMFKSCTSLTGVTLPNTVRTVGDNAFDGCSQLTAIAFGSGVAALGDRAFADCGLTALVLPDNVTELGAEAFKNNPAIASISFGAGITSISESAFAGNNAIERLTIPKTVTAIGANAFADWSHLTTLTVSGNALASIGSKAFANAVRLADAYVEPTVAPTVADDAFSGAGSSITGSKTFHVASTEAYTSWSNAATGYAIVALSPDYLSEGIYYRTSAAEQWSDGLPETFTKLYIKTAGDDTVMTAEQMTALAAAVKALSAPATLDFSETTYAATTFPASFRSNANLADIVLPQNVTATASGAFSATGLTSATVRADIAYASQAFANCASLTTAVVEEGVKTIADNMFQNTGLTGIKLPDSVETIGQNAFNGCAALASIDLGEGVATVSNYAFQKCTALTEIYFPDATQTIGQNAFAGCIRLAKVSFGKGMQTINAYSFTGTSYMGGACPLLGDITCRAVTPPTLKDDYGTGPFGGSWYDHAGKEVPAENRRIHLPKSTDPNGGSGAYADSSWAELATSSYGYTFVYDLEE